MSELKAFTFGLGQYMEDGSPCVVAFDGEKNPRLASDEKFYLKSEADKFISDLEESHKKEVGQLLMEIMELKDKLQNVSELLKETREWLIESQKMHKRCADNAIKQLRHHKYKRCLAMAKWCEAEVRNIRRTPLCDMDEHEYWQYENDFWQRWQKRWLDIA